MGGRKIEARELRCAQRQPLQDIIPLPAPFVVYVDPTNYCNFRCRFCPTGDEKLLREVGRSKNMLSLELFCKIVADLGGFGTKLRLLSLYKDGEPLLNPDFPEMVRIAKVAGISERIWTKTNGSLLKPSLNRQLVAAGLDHICISIEALDREGYLELAGVAIDYAALLENIADLYQHRGTCEVYIKIVDVNLSEAQKERFYANFQPISTHVGIEKLMGWSNSGTRDFTLGTMPDTYDGLPFVDKEVCAYPFYVLAVNSDGTVSVCGNDWSQQTVVGSVLNSLMEIWHSRELLEFRMMMLDGQRSRNGACGDCYYLKIVPDNIDQYASMLKSRLLKAHNSGCRDCADD
jgi:radical SAM protein with 4Fe4S-binding SPASM domain